MRPVNSLRQRLNAAKRRFYAWLNELHAERMPPVNYKSMSISDTQIHYVDLSGEAQTILFESIVKIEFVREEALFPCFDGPYLETKWLVQTVGGSTIEIMDEMAHRRQVLNAFTLRLPQFRVFEANVGLAAKSSGRWLCFQKPSP